MTDPPAPPSDSRGFGFLLAGVQKAGTSSLFALISEHPQVAHPRSKELHFFSNDKYDWANPNYDDYHSKIRWKEWSVIAGEGTPRYLFWPGAMERIRAYNPSMRIILSFRDPIERAYSNWAMAKGQDQAHPGFGETIREVWATSWPRTAAAAGRGLTQTIVSRGFYGEQLENALGLFERDHFLLLNYHQLFLDREATLDRIARFIGVRPFKKMPAERHRRAAPKHLDAEPPSAEDIAALAELYAPDLERFGEISGFDVTVWPSTRIVSGTLDPADLAAALADPALPIPPVPEKVPVVDKAAERRAWREERARKERQERRERRKRWAGLELQRRATQTESAARANPAPSD